MAFDILNIGTVANDGTGDTLRAASAKLNANFAKGALAPLGMAAGTPAADQLGYYTGPNGFAFAVLTAFARQILAGADADAVRALLSVDTSAGVDAKIAALVASSPAALDTLNELAAALGNDPNFATTMTNALAAKLALAGGTMAGDIAMAGHKVTGLPAPTATNEPARKAETDANAAAIALKLALAGGTMTGPIAMGGNAITGLQAGSANGDATNVGQLIQAVPPGVVQAFAGGTVPTGWFECAGQAISRATYAALFAAIGTTYGAGDGSTTFALPNLRGEFIRGWDNGRGVDASRVRGSAQLHATESHKHDLPLGWDAGSTSLTLYMWHDTAATPVYGSSVAIGASCSAPTFNVNAGGGNVRYGRTNTAAYASGETRPRNVAMLYIIKA